MYVIKQPSDSLALPVLKWSLSFPQTGPSHSTYAELIGGLGSAGEAVITKWSDVCCESCGDPYASDCVHATCRTLIMMTAGDTLKGDLNCCPYISFIGTAWSLHKLFSASAALRDPFATVGLNVTEVTVTAYCRLNCILTA